MLTKKMRMKIEEALKVKKIHPADISGGYSMTAASGTEPIYKRKPSIWKTSKPEPSSVRQAALAARGKLIKKNLDRQVAQKNKVIKMRPRVEPRSQIGVSPREKQVLAAGYNTSVKDLEDIINDQYNISKLTGEEKPKELLRKRGLDPDREMERSTARNREARKAMRWQAQQRAAIKARDKRKQAAIASVR